MTSNIFSRRNGLRTAALASVAALGVGFSANSYAVDGTGTATATVVAPISIANDSALDFGKFTKSAGTITMTPAGGRTATGGVTTLSTVTPGAAGQLTVNGDANATYSISAVGGTLTDAVSTETMTLANITVAASTATGTLITTGTIGAGGSQVLKTGGDLTVGATQASGTYTGGYTVTVEYN